MEKDTKDEVIENDVVIDKEDDTIKHKINHNRNEEKNKKHIMYIIIGLLCVILLGLVIYIVADNNSNNNTLNDNDVGNEIVNGNVYDEDTVINNNIGYVSCDDNTALLNVRNSTSGNIIDGLSCYKEVTIDEELGSTDVCDKWYKINYTKNGSSYTGYACGTYIKKLEVSTNIINNVKSLVDKANEYYNNSVLKAYCGNTNGTKTINFDDLKGEYVKSEYKNIEELKNYLYSFLDKNLIKLKLELSDINNPKYYDNYYEIDGNLYCRNYSGQGWITYYTNNYDIEVVNVSDNKINVNIAYQYINDNSSCKLEEIEKCKNSDFIYEIGKIVIENNIITKMDFHK